MGPLSGPPSKRIPGRKPPVCIAGCDLVQASVGVLKPDQGLRVHA